MLEIKTRAANSPGPLTSIEKFPAYFIQCQLQLLCTDLEFCVLQSYHPETKSSNLFLVKRNNTIMFIIKEIVDSIYYNRKLLTWGHDEIIELKNFGKNIIGKIPEFECLTPLRKFIKKLTKLTITEVDIYNNIDFSLQ